MSTHTSRPIAAAVAIAVVASAAPGASAQTRPGGRRVTPDQPFATVWIVDRGMPDKVVWQTLVDITTPGGFEPVVLHAGDDERWTRSLSHLLELLPQGDTVWVTDRGTLFDVDRVVSPGRPALSDGGPPVYSADASLDDVAALIAMRTGGRLVLEPPLQQRPTIFVGLESPASPRDRDIHLPTRADALAYANSMAPRPVVMIVRAGALRPEVVLWAHQRGARILEVEVPPYDITDPSSERVAVEDVARQVRAGVAELLGPAPPEALVVAGDWYDIPFRYPQDPQGAAAGYPGPCPGCDNNSHEFAADLLYANLDDDPWVVPDVPVGRLMSPFHDLLAIQTVVGIWADHGAFPAARDGVFLGLLGTEHPTRQAAVDGWRDAYPGRSWSVVGPDGVEPDYHLDQGDFFQVADRADIVIVHGHGHPDIISPNGSPFNQAISGAELARRSTSAVPSFWFLHACGTGKPDLRDLNPDQTLLVGLQSRLAFGSLMAVENTSSASSEPYWWGSSVEPGMAVGELVRRFASAAVAAYRDGAAVAQGMPSTTGSDANRWFNSRAVLSWIGDPLTVVASNP